MQDDLSGLDVAVLASGGIESAILCVEMLQHAARVFPLYVRFGLRWEDVELAHLRTFLQRATRAGLMPLHVLEEPVADVYGASHWSTQGPTVPDAQTPDEAVYLPGRNLLLGAKAAVWCRMRGVEALTFGCLQTNPFPDSTPEFFADLESLANRALGGRLRIIRPFAHLHKQEVIRRGIELDLPLAETFSCIQPVRSLHCGVCNKCEERRVAFQAAGLADQTPYAEPAQPSRE
ncbi:MAG: 7-cyano-7-deazaguanine synthase [Isosphaeraceae bacterium]|nr:7-cyano-7-deazaguanine synthase [Isosphaeraceae bacterium]